MKELSRRLEYHEEDGFACGPFGLTVIDAEIVIDDNGDTVYLHGQWVDAAGDEILFEATTESIYDAYIRMNNAKNDEEMDSACEERDRISEYQIENDEKYQAYYDDLKTMIIEEMKAHDFDTDELE